MRSPVSFIPFPENQRQLVPRGVGALAKGGFAFGILHARHEIGGWVGRRQRLVVDFCDGNSPAPGTPPVRCLVVGDAAQPGGKFRGAAKSRYGSVVVPIKRCCRLVVAFLDSVQQVG
jgi:hypothetical protein